MLVRSMIAIISNETIVDTIIPKNAINNFTPVNIKINATPYFIYLNILFNLAKRKYRLLKPNMAKILEL